MNFLLLLLAYITLPPVVTLGVALVSEKLKGEASE